MNPAQYLRGITRPDSRWRSPTNPADHSPVALRNHIMLEQIGPDGQVKEIKEHWGNTLVTGGLSNLAALIATGGTANAASAAWVNAEYIGTSTTAESSTQTALVASTASVTLGGGSMNIVNQGARTTRWTATFASSNPAGAATIAEVGLFFTTTAATTMIARTMLGTDSVNKGASDQINISYDIIFITA